MPVRLDEVTEWVEFVIPGSDRPVRLARLHAAGGASVSLVRFPAGWSRPMAGHYPAAEEFVVLDGAITVGRRFEAGDYAFLPPRTVRTDSRTESGALVLAWFSAAPTWHEGVGSDPVDGEVVQSRASGVLRRPSAEVPGGYAVGPAPATVAGQGADLLDPATRTWEWVEPGATPTMDAAVVHLRTWG